MSMLVAPSMSFPKDSTGIVLIFTLYDGSSVLDISAATSMLFYAKDGENTQIINGEAMAFVTDGSNGQVKITAPAAMTGTARDLWCDVEIIEPSGKFISEQTRIEISERAKV